MHLQFHSNKSQPLLKGLLHFTQCALLAAVNWWSVAASPFPHSKEKRNLPEHILVFLTSKSMKDINLYREENYLISLICITIFCQNNSWGFFTVHNFMCMKPLQTGILAPPWDKRLTLTYFLDISLNFYNIIHKSKSTLLHNVWALLFIYSVFIYTNISIYIYMGII